MGAASSDLGALVRRLEFRNSASSLSPAIEALDYMITYDYHLVTRKPLLEKQDSGAGFQLRLAAAVLFAVVQLGFEGQCYERQLLDRSQHRSDCLM